MSSKLLLELLRESGLSPEEFGNLMGVSGMTLRRWIEKPNNKPLSDFYTRAVRDAVFKLVIEGRVAANAECVTKVLSNSGDLMQQAAVKALGFPDNLTANLDDHQDQIVSGLAHLGSMASRREHVEKNKHSLPFYRRMGREWNERISVLNRVIASKQFTMLDKALAYGAFFYLFMPFDLIPDSIPVFGLMDDFSVLGIAASYYIARHKLKNG